MCVCVCLGGGGGGGGAYMRGLHTFSDTEHPTEVGIEEDGQWPLSAAPPLASVWLISRQGAYLRRAREGNCPLK